MLRLHVLYVWFGEVQVGLTSVSSVVFSTHLCFLHLSAQFKTGAGRGMPVAIGAMRRAAIRALKEHVGELVGKNVCYGMLVTIRAVMPIVQSRRENH